MYNLYLYVLREVSPSVTVCSNMQLAANSDEPGFSRTLTLPASSWPPSCILAYGSTVGRQRADIVDG